MKLTFIAADSGTDGPIRPTNEKSIKIERTFRKNFMTKGSDYFYGYLKRGCLFSPENPTLLDPAGARSFGENVAERGANLDVLVKSRPMAMGKGPEARNSAWPGTKAYM